MTSIYKILPRDAWRSAQQSDTFIGSDVDRRDGFIHFSTAEQARETARRHFQGQRDLVVLEVEATALGSALKWEPSRGGALFPHLYADLPPALVVAVHDAPLGADGVPVLDFLGVVDVPVRPDT